jgi:hypothetical protein
MTMPAVSSIPADPVLFESFSYVESGSVRRIANQRIPRCLQDIYPEPSVAIEPAAQTRSGVKRVILHVRDSFRTTVNGFGILREYSYRPSYDPDAFVKPEDLANFSTKTSPTHTASASAEQTGSFLPPWPFANLSKFLLMNWQNTGSIQKSEQELDRLVKDVIGHPAFKPEDLVGFSAHRENKRLDSAPAAGDTHTPFSGDDWRETAVEIEIPVDT